MPKLFSEPLFHFLLLGFLMFVADGLLGRSGNDATMRIEVSADDISKMSSLWQRTWTRPPTAEELRGLVEQHIREEVLYREAKALGLDRDDTIVRRRLAQKLEFLSEDLQVMSEPDEAQLTSWYRDHAEDYLEPERTSFVQVYFSRDRRGQDAIRDASQALLALTAAGASPPEAGRELGDPSLLQYAYTSLSSAEVARHLGAMFAEQLDTVPASQWTGPVESSLGIHLVYVIEREPGRQLELDEVRQQVRNELERNHREQANRSFYEELRARYEVFVDDQAITEIGS